MPAVLHERAQADNRSSLVAPARCSGMWFSGWGCMYIDADGGSSTSTAVVTRPKSAHPCLNGSRPIVFGADCPNGMSCAGGHGMRLELLGWTASLLVAAVAAAARPPSVAGAESGAAAEASWGAPNLPWAPSPPASTSSAQH